MIEFSSITDLIEYGSFCKACYKHCMTQYISIDTLSEIPFDILHDKISFLYNNCKYNLFFNKTTSPSIGNRQLFIDSFCHICCSNIKSHRINSSNMIELYSEYIHLKINNTEYKLFKKSKQDRLSLFTSNGTIDIPFDIDFSNKQLLHAKLQTFINFS